MRVQLGFCLVLLWVVNTPLAYKSQPAVAKRHYDVDATQQLRYRLDQREMKRDDVIKASLMHPRTRAIEREEFHDNSRSAKTPTTRSMNAKTGRLDLPITQFDAVYTSPQSLQHTAQLTSRSTRLKKRDSRWPMLAGIFIGGTGGILLLIILYFYFRRRWALRDRERRVQQIRQHGPVVDTLARESPGTQRSWVEMMKERARTAFKRTNVNDDVVV